MTFIEDAMLLSDAGGVGGLLRFRVRKADFYTIAGRDRPNEDLVVTKPAQDDERQRRGSPRRNFIPGAAPVGESPAPRETSPGREGRKKATAGRAEDPVIAEKAGRSQDGPARGSQL